MKKAIVFAVFLSLVGLALTGCGSTALTSAKVYLQQKDYENARKQLEMAVQQTPNNDEAHFLLGMVYGEKGLFEKMNVEFDKAMQLNPRKRSEPIRNERYKYWVNTYNRGVTTIGHAIVIESIIDSLKVTGRNNRIDSIKIIQKNYYNTAVSEFKTATIIDSTKKESLENLSLAYARLGQLDNAINTYIRLHNIAPDSVLPLINLGRLYINNKEYNKASETLEEALKIAPKNDKVLDNIIYLASAYEGIKNYDGALDMYRKAAEIKPTNKDYFYNIGVILANQARTLKMDSDSLNSLDMKKYKDRSDSLNKAATKKFLEAGEAYEKAFKLDPNDVGVNFNLGLTYMFLEQLDKALPFFQKVVSLEPKNGSAWYQLGIIYSRKNMKKESQEAFAKAEAALK